MDILFIKDAILEFLNKLPEPNRSACIKILADNEQRFLKAPGSQHNHQAWIGGYLGHIYETFVIAQNSHESLSLIRSLPFSLEDALLVLWLHDLEKPFKYLKPETNFVDDNAKAEFVRSMIKQYGIVLTDEHVNALAYIHGEGADYNSHKRTQLPLAAFVHCCDTISARIWFNFPEHY